MRRKKNKFEDTLKYIDSKHDENLQKLLSLSFDRLEGLKKYYYDWYSGAEESGYTESAIVNKKHHDIVVEAINIKLENERKKSNLNPPSV